MDWQSLLAVAALIGIAIVAGGAAVRLADAIGGTAVLATVLLVAVVVLAVVVVTVLSLRRSSTPYW